MKLKKVSLTDYIDKRNKNVLIPVLGNYETKINSLKAKMEEALTDIENKLKILEEVEEAEIEEDDDEEEDSSDLDSLRSEIEKLKKRKPEPQFVGGSGATGSYYSVTSNSATFTKHSFNPGINIIGVRSGEPTTIYLPSDLEPNQLVSIKDELGVAAVHPITILVNT